MHLQAELNCSNSISTINTNTLHTLHPLTIIDFIEETILTFENCKRFAFLGNSYFFRGLSLLFLVSVKYTDYFPLVKREAPEKKISTFNILFFLYFLHYSTSILSRELTLLHFSFKVSKCYDPALVTSDLVRQGFRLFHFLPLNLLTLISRLEICRGK